MKSIVEMKNSAGGGDEDIGCPSHLRKLIFQPVAPHNARPPQIRKLAQLFRHAQDL